jgi:multidrug efflux system membrane fusion protein
MPVLALKILRRPRAWPLCTILVALFLTACSKPAPEAEAVRPVRAMVLAAGDAAVNAEFSGEVRPRIESRLGFRVGGKITERRVDVGAVVSRGQVLMQLDPQDLKLAQAQSQAALRAGETNLALAQADLKRYQELRRQNFVSQAVLDTKAAALKAAQANVDAARAAYRGQSNQAGYASLASDTDGVVTAIDAEVGQVVAAGTPVVRVARTDQMDVVIGIPEDKVGSIGSGAAVAVRLWAAPGQAIAGNVREIAPVADAATRTYPVKVSIPASAGVRLGMTATVQFVSSGGAGQMRVPLSALHQNKGATALWLIENGAVRLVPVQLGAAVGNEVLVTAGVKPGQRIVTAGVNLLKNGQTVRILTADVARRADAEAAPAAGAAQ